MDSKNKTTRASADAAIRMFRIANCEDCEPTSFIGSDLVELSLKPGQEASFLTTFFVLFAHEYLNHRACVDVYFLELGATKSSRVVVSKLLKTSQLKTAPLVYIPMNYNDHFILVVLTKTSKNITVFYVYDSLEKEATTLRGSGATFNSVAAAVGAVAQRYGLVTPKKFEPTKSGGKPNKKGTYYEMSELAWKTGKTEQARDKDSASSAMMSCIEAVKHARDAFGDDLEEVEIGAPGTPGKTRRHHVLRMARAWFERLEDTAGALEEIMDVRGTPKKPRARLSASFVDLPVPSPDDELGPENPWTKATNKAAKAQVQQQELLAAVLKNANQTPEEDKAAAKLMQQKLIIENRERQVGPTPGASQVETPQRTVNQGGCAAGEKCKHKDLPVTASQHRCERCKKRYHGPCGHEGDALHGGVCFACQPEEDDPDPTAKRSSEDGHHGGGGEAGEPRNKRRKSADSSAGDNCESQSGLAEGMTDEDQLAEDKNLREAKDKKSSDLVARGTKDKRLWKLVVSTFNEYEMDIHQMFAMTKFDMVTPPREGEVEVEIHSSKEAAAEGAQYFPFFLHFGMIFVVHYSKSEAKNKVPAQEELHQFVMHSVRKNFVAKLWPPEEPEAEVWKCPKCAMQFESRVWYDGHIDFMMSHNRCPTAPKFLNVQNHLNFVVETGPALLIARLKAPVRLLDVYQTPHHFVAGNKGFRHGIRKEADAEKQYIKTVLTGTDKRYAAHPEDGLFQLMAKKLDLLEDGAKKGKKSLPIDERPEGARLITMPYILPYCKWPEDLKEKVVSYRLPVAESKPPTAEGRPKNFTNWLSSPPSC